MRTLRRDDKPRTRSAWQGCAALALASLFGTAHADVVRFKYIDNGEESIGSLPQNILRPDGAGGMTDGAGVRSYVRAVDSFNAFLLTGPDGTAESSGDRDTEESESQSPGATVTAFAQFGDTLTPAPAVRPVRARTELFANHVAVGTSISRFFSGVSEENPNLRYFKDFSSFGEATSTWFDLWTADESAPIELDFRLDGEVRIASDPCFVGGTLICGFIVPPGTTGFFTQNSNARLQASVTVFDLDSMIACDEQFGDECDGDFEIERVVAHVGAEITLDDEETPDGFAVDITDTIAFDVIAGHRYFAISKVGARAQDGGVLDFMNTFALTRFSDPQDAITSFAERNLGAQLPRGMAPPVGVPTPSTAWLLIAGGGALLGLRRRTERDHRGMRG